MNVDMNVDASKDPDRLEREIDEQRREINETLRALEQKFTAQEIGSEIMHYFGGHGREWAANLGHSMKANPIPTLLTAIGLTWLMMGDRNPRYYRPAYRGDYAYGGRDFETAGDFEGHNRGVFHDATDAAHAAAQTVKEKAGALGEKAAHAREALHERAAHTREALHERALHTREALRSRAYSARSSASYYVRNNFEHMSREQPLALGAVGIALGALIGAALPRTERENRMLGRAGERIKQRGREMAREGYERASQKAAEMADTAKETLKRGLGENQQWQSESDASQQNRQAGSGDETQWQAGGNSQGTTAASQPQRAGTAPGA